MTKTLAARPGKLKYALQSRGIFQVPTIKKPKLLPLFISTLNVSGPNADRKTQGKIKRNYIDLTCPSLSQQTLSWTVHTKHLSIYYKFWQNFLSPIYNRRQIQSKFPVLNGTGVIKTAFIKQTPLLCHLNADKLRDSCLAECRSCRNIHASFSSLILKQIFRSDGRSESRPSSTTVRSGQRSRGLTSWLTGQSHWLSWRSVPSGPATH